MRVTDLKQWAYCRRIVYYQHRMPEWASRPTRWVKARRLRTWSNRLEMRRTMREYGFEGAVRKFGVWLENDNLGLAGKLDLLRRTDTEAAIVEFS